MEYGSDAIKITVELRNGIKLETTGVQATKFWNRLGRTVDLVITTKEAFTNEDKPFIQFVELPNDSKS